MTPLSDCAAAGGGPRVQSPKAALKDRRFRSQLQRRRGVSDGGRPGTEHQSGPKRHCSDAHCSSRPPAVGAAFAWQHMTSDSTH